MFGRSKKNESRICKSCGAELSKGENICKICGMLYNSNDDDPYDIPILYGPPMPEKTIRVCDNCDTPLKRGQKFCVMCGHPVRKPAKTIIDYSDMVCLYGPPPMLAKAHCENCGESVKRAIRINDDKCYCPKCGKQLKWEIGV